MVIEGAGLIWILRPVLEYVVNRSLAFTTIRRLGGRVWALEMADAVINQTNGEAATAGPLIQLTRWTFPPTKWPYAKRRARGRP